MSHNPHIQPSGDLLRRRDTAVERLKACDLCPHECGVDRTAGEIGVCKTGRLARVSSYGPHRGEEDPLRGSQGSGTIFFSRCNLGCRFCQNHDISQEDAGRERSADELAEIMLELQDLGCHNINLVSPSHVVAQFLKAYVIGISKGLEVPIVYNTGGYDSLSTLKLLDGVVDIYMPDMKYGDEMMAKQFSCVDDYVKTNFAAVKEMHRQVGDLEVDADGVAIRGLLVRHLVLPNGVAGSEEVFEFLAKEVSKNTYINIMDQYHPAYRAGGIEELSRRLTTEEYEDAVHAALNIGLKRHDERKKRFLFW